MKISAEPLRLYSLAELAKLTGLAERTLQKHIADPENPLDYTHHLSTHPKRGWRFDSAMVQRYLDRFRVKGGAGGE